MDFEKKLNRFLIHFVIETTEVPGISQKKVDFVKNILIDVFTHLLGVYKGIRELFK